MKFSLKLDESLFDDDFDSLKLDSTPMMISEYDDDFSEYDHDVDNVLPGPAEGSDTGVASELIALINDEWEAIQGYNNAIATLRAVITENPVYEDAIKVLEEIASEENTHVGQLQEVLKRISPNAEEINKGTVEAKSQMGLVGGVLPVQSWNSAPTSKQEATNVIDNMCTISDIDDEM
jgi:hypothetical protein